ncbi:glycerol-3-phosphate 1-O-acyltransferase PlsY [Aliikangiella sp. IMCC44653]
MDFTFAGFLVFAYLSGSISTAILVCKILTLPDPRIIGSHNPGATNVLRIGGKKAAIATLIGDILKTGLPLLIALNFNLQLNQLIWIGASALLGHCFPLFYQFKGGKGVASIFAITLLLLPQLGVISLGAWFITALTFKRSSLASLIACCTLATFSYHFQADVFWEVLCLTLIVLLRHLSNIKNLILRKEPLIGDSLSQSSTEELHNRSH